MELKNIEIQAEDLIQSPFLDLEAAGSDGEDGSVKGVHLKWRLDGTLGEYHLPKGKFANQGAAYAPSQPGVGFNKNDDFVHLYKVELKKRYPTKINLLENEISTIKDRTWFFSVPITSIEHTTIVNTVEVSFKDEDNYDLASFGKIFTEKTDRIAFLENYKGVIQVAVDGKLCFAATVRMKLQDGIQPSATQIRYESISLFSNKGIRSLDRFISYRNTGQFNPENTLERDNYPLIDDNAVLRPLQLDQFQWMSQNIESIRFDYQEMIPVEIHLETYQEFITGVSAQDEGWEPVGEGDFSLHFDNNNNDLAFARLDQAIFDANGNSTWPRFKRNTEENILGPENAYKLKKQNYEAKWLAPVGLKFAVKNYLALSKESNNLKAIIEAPSESNEDGAQGLSIPILDALQIATNDFHVARMLGLGCIDSFEQDETNKRYVYLAQYKTEKLIENGYPNTTIEHFQMSLPLGAIDNLVPAKPQNIQFTFGFDGPHQDLIVPISLVDDEGYTRDGERRYINVNIDEVGNEIEYGEFFFRSTPVDFKAISLPTSYGIEYRGYDLEQPEMYFRNPKVVADDTYLDGVQNKEVIPLIDEGGGLIYRHVETENGTHDYAVYAINAFSRPSDLSTIATITSEFSNQVKLLAPNNLFSTLIQKEIPLVLSTSEDQALLDQITDGDKTLVKTVFSIDNTHYANHQSIHEVDFFFRENTPNIIEGVVKNVFQDPSAIDQVIIETEERAILSQAGAGSLDPDVSHLNSTQLSQQFDGAAFACQNGRFTIVKAEKDASGNAKFYLKKNAEHGSVEEPIMSGNFVIKEAIVIPEVAQQFTVVENMLNLENWENNMLSKKVAIKNFSPIPVKIQLTDDTVNDFEEVLSIQRNVANTDVYVSASVDNVKINGDFHYRHQIGGIRYESSDTVIIVGDYQDVFASGDTFSVLTCRDKANVGDYVIADVVYNIDNEETSITISGSFPNPASNHMILAFDRKAIILSKDVNDNYITVKGDIREGFYITHTEVTYTAEQKPILRTAGGLVDDAVIIPIFDEVRNEETNQVEKVHLGRFAVEFCNKTLEEHSDTDVQFQRGFLRVRQANSYELVNYIVEAIHRDVVGSEGPDQDKEPTIKLIVRNPVYENETSENLLSSVGTSSSPNNTEIKEVVFYPSYQVYKRAEPPKMISDQLLPELGQLEKYTLLGARTVDSLFRIESERGAYSKISVPARIKAIEIIDPVEPADPTGPTFATRPDSFVKSTYTFDVDFPKNPYAVLFYRGNTSTILGILYNPQTADEIREELDAIDPIYYTDIWRILTWIQVEDNNKTFKTHQPTGFQFRLPNNEAYEAPSSVPDKPPLYPFKDELELNESVTDTYLNQSFTILQMVEQALSNAFVPLQPKPLMYSELKESTQTSPDRPKIRGDHDELLSPSDNRFNPAPFVVKIPGEIKVRFTDYSLDGASNELYFYYAMTMGNQMTFSGRSKITGPIQLVNSAPARPPVMRKVTAQLANPFLDIPTAVVMEIDQYLAQEKIKKIKVYRTTETKRSFSVRTMDLIKTQEVSGNVIDQVIDDFVNEDFPPYGAPLYYRLVAIREIENEVGELEDIPSEPSTRVLANIVDVFNPEPPTLSFSGNFNSSTNVYNDVELQWTRTAYNGIYRVFKMTGSGNWSLVGEQRENQENYTYSIGDLNKTDSDGEEIYHRFKVDVENSSGLLNLTTFELTI